METMHSLLDRCLLIVIVVKKPYILSVYQLKYVADKKP